MTLHTPLNPMLCVPCHLLLLYLLEWVPSCSRANLQGHCAVMCHPCSCTNLQDLWLQNNQLRNLEELRVLSTLRSLARLCLSSNPLVALLPPEQYRAVLLSLCPHLQVRTTGARTARM